MNFQRISPSVSDTGKPSGDILSTDNNTLFQRRLTDSKLENTRTARHPVVRNLLQRLTLGNESVWIRIGSLRESVGDSTGAMEAYNNALRFASNSTVPLCKLGSILLRKGHLEQALVYIQQALSSENNSGEAWSLMGFYFLKTGAYEQAYEAFQNAVRLLGEKSSAFLWYGIGLLYELNSSTDYALEAYQNALKLKPLPEQTVDIYLHIAHIYEEREALDIAWEYLNKALLHISNLNFNTSFLAEVYFRMGAIQEIKRNFAAAKEFYLKALKENPNHAKSLQQLGWIEHEEGRSDEGFKILKRAVEADPNDGQGWYLLGRLHMAKKEYRSAYDNYQRAVYCNSRNPRFWCSIGVLYYQMGQYRDAMDAYTRAIRLNPNLSEVWYDLGTLYESFSQYKDALDAYKKALELSPNNSQIKSRVLETEKHLKEDNAALSLRQFNSSEGNVDASRVGTVQGKDFDNVALETLPKVASGGRDDSHHYHEALETLQRSEWKPNDPVEVSPKEDTEKQKEEESQRTNEKNQNRDDKEPKEQETAQALENWKKHDEDVTSTSATASSSFQEDEEAEVITGIQSGQVDDVAAQSSYLEGKNSEQELTSPQEHDEIEEEEHVVKRQKTNQPLTSVSESCTDNDRTLDENDKSSSTLQQNADLESHEEVDKNNNNNNASEGTGP